MPRGIPKKKMMVATLTFFSEAGDVRMGELFSEDHPAVKANPQWFTKSEREQSEVEMATAAPGEARE